PYDITGNVLFSTTQYNGTPTTVGEAAEAVEAGANFVPVDLTLDLNKPAGAATVSLKLLANVENPTAEAITTSKSSDIANVPGSTSRVYKYFEIESNLNEANVDEVMVKFSVDKNWLIENQIDSKNVSFYHYVFHSPGVWEELEATQTSQDNDYYYYESWTSQLNGLYAIAGRPGHVSLMETLTGSISGLVFIDANSNGQKDETEIGAKDIIVELYVDDGDQILNTEKDKITLAQQTGADGRYNFNELEEGNYIVFISRDGLPENYELTSESDVLWLSMYQNENIENVNFGYYEVAKEDTARIDQIKQNRDKESTTYITKKIRRVAEASPIIRKIITQTEEKISITPAIVWAIIIVLVLIFLVWQLTRGVDCGHKK
ncbi:MAG: PGF-pre-PGF domain-containing protein, partial [Patescibacteria group bacterium]